jgi:hypothetical protein
MTAEMYLPQFLLKQKLTLMVNRYEIYTLGPDGKPGELMAFAEQKRMAFKEQVTFYSRRLQDAAGLRLQGAQGDGHGLGLRHRRRGGQPLGFFRKDFGASLLRSTFHLEGPGYAGTGQERSMFVALLRRFTDVPFLPIHFDFVGAEGQPLLSSTRRPASVTATPSPCPTSASTSGSPRRSRSPSTR